MDLLSFICDMTQWNQLDIKNATDQKPNKSTEKNVALLKFDNLSVQNVINACNDQLSLSNHFTV